MAVGQTGEENVAHTLQVTDANPLVATCTCGKWTATRPYGNAGGSKAAAKSRIETAHFKHANSNLDFWDQVVRIIADELCIDDSEITRNAHFMDDLGADSLDVVELTMRFEEEFDISISDDDAERLTTAGKMHDFLEKAKK